MALRPRLDLRQTQRLGLSPGVMAALRVLRLPPAELAEALAEEARANPFLLPGLPPPPPAGPAGAEGGLDTLAARAADWQEALLHQIAQHPLPPRLAALAARLVAELDERGWLDMPLPDFAQEAECDLDEAEAALAVVQACEPVGVGARDLDECLRLQLGDLGLTPAEARATLAELARFARRDWPGLQRALGLDRAEVAARAALLRRLNPHPLAAAAAPAGEALRPDLIVSRGPLGEIRVEPARDHLPRPAIDAGLARRAEAEGFGAELLERARALVRAVESRGATLLRIGDWLARRQDRALREGPGALLAASRVECAQALGLHPSTVGRAVAGKALAAEGRVWPLALLFSAPRPDAGAGSARAVAHRIAALIATEEPGRPLSDGALAARLATEGVDIARRTVAKYRNGLRIPPAHLRRGRG